MLILLQEILIILLGLYVRIGAPAVSTFKQHLKT